MEWNIEEYHGRFSNITFIWTLISNRGVEDQFHPLWDKREHMTERRVSRISSLLTVVGVLCMFGYHVCCQYLQFVFLLLNSLCNSICKLTCYLKLYPPGHFCSGGRTNVLQHLGLNRCCFVLIDQFILFCLTQIDNLLKTMLKSTIIIWQEELYNWDMSLPWKTYLCCLSIFSSNLKIFVLHESR